MIKGESVDLRAGKGAPACSEDSLVSNEESSQIFYPSNAKRLSGTSTVFTAMLKRIETTHTTERPLWAVLKMRESGGRC